MREFWSPAQEKSDLWRTLLGAVLTLLVFLGSTWGVFMFAGLVLGVKPSSLLGQTGPLATMVFFGTFVGFHIALLILLPLLHKRGYTTLFGPARRLNLRHLGLGLVTTLALATLLYGVMFLERIVMPDDLEPVVNQIRPFSEWLVWLLPALAVIFMQIFAEEVFFRGYLLQQLRARFKSALIWAFLPSFLFGVLHFDAESYGTVNAAAYVLNTTVTGVLLSLITMRTGNLGAATGLHFGNNAALTVIGIEGNLDGFSLFGVGTALEGAYTAWSILSQTGFTVLLFVLWWLWMNRRDRIANAAHAA